MNQLETERKRAAAAEAEVAKLKEAAEKKIEERLNEMARRLNRANQANEEKYKSMYTEVSDMKTRSCRPGKPVCAKCKIWSKR